MTKPSLKSLLLSLYYHGSMPLRWWRRQCAALEGRVPMAVLYYHRVADEKPGDWTCSNRVFARQIRWLATNFDMISMAELQRRIRSGENARPAVHITFDDGYSENCQEAIPLLVKMRIPCTYFVTAENVFSDRPFAHDVALGNRFPPNTIEQLRAMAGSGIEIGAHSRTHPDLGAIDDPQRLDDEVVESGQELAAALGKPIRYFAFPFGQYMNLNSDAFRIARQAGYEAVCSAYGGYNLPGGDPFHIQRIHADSDMIHLKNHASVDPRKIDVPRFVCQRSASQIPGGAAPGLDKQLLTPDP